MRGEEVSGLAVWVSARVIAAGNATSGLLIAALGVAVLRVAARDGYYSLLEPPRLPSGALPRWAPGIPPAWVYPDPMQTASHGAFHGLQLSGLGMTGGLLLVLIGIYATRRLDGWVILALLAAIPTVAGPLLAEFLYGSWHEETLPILMLWLSSLSVATCAVERQRLKSSPKMTAAARGSSENHFWSEKNHSHAVRRNATSRTSGLK